MEGLLKQQLSRLCVKSDVARIKASYGDVPGGLGGARGENWQDQDRGQLLFSLWERQGALEG